MSGYAALNEPMAGSRQSILPLAESQSLAWLNAIVAKLWPKINAAAQKIVADSVEPAIQAKVPGPLTGIHFKEFSLGTQPVVLGPVRVYDMDKKGLKMHMALELQSNTDITLQCGIADAGIKNLRISGEIIIRLQQLIDESPIVGAVTVYFIDNPRVDFDFSGACALLNTKTVAGIIRSTISGVIGNMLVLPNQIAVCLGTEEQGIDLAKAKCATPMGLLRVQPKRARGLKGMDWHVLGKATSDPYAVVELGDQRYQSSTVETTCDPDWPETDYDYFTVYDREQKLFVTLYDEDYGTSDDFLGCAKSVKVATALGDAELLESGVTLYSRCRDAREEASGDPCGTVSVGVELFQFVKHSLGDAEMCMLRVKLDEAVIPHAAGPEAKVIVTIKDGDWSICKHSPLGIIPAKLPIAAAIGQVLVGVVKRCAARGMSSSEIAEVTALKEEDVEAIVGGGEISKDEITKDGQHKIPQTVKIGAILWIPVPRVQLLGLGVVYIVVATKDDKTIAETSVALDTVLCADGHVWAPEVAQRLTGEMGDVHLDVQMSILGTRSVSADVFFDANEDYVE